jgi:hypothetical protein
VDAAPTSIGGAGLALHRRGGRVNTNPNGSLRRRHVGELVGVLSRDLSRLIKLEVELAKTEARELADELQAQVQRTVAAAQSEVKTGGHRVATRLSENGKQAGAAGGNCLSEPQFSRWAPSAV